jgi:PhoH-like ATPase
LKRIYVLDTNVLLDYPQAFEGFDKAKIVIPFKVLEELDAHKTAPGQLGGAARAAVRFLDGLAAQGRLLPAENNKALISVHPWSQECQDQMAKFGLEDLPDNRIIATALCYKQAVLVSNDLAMRLKASAVGLTTESRTSSSSANSISEIYSGFCSFTISDEQINQLYAAGEIAAPKGFHALANQYIHFCSNSNEKHTAIGKLVKGRIRKIDAVKEVFGVKPRNLEQVAAFDAILDDKITLVSLLGQAGTGKSFVALAAGLAMVLDQHRYKKLLVIRSTTSVGESVGWLPGSLAEKTRPLFDALMDNLALIFKTENSVKTQAMVDHLVENGTVELSTPTFMRGRSMPGTLILVDEAQNLTRHEIKTIATRLGEGSKLILLGDLNQIDTPKLDALNNGFIRVIEAFAGQDCSAHITLTKSERSSFAALAAELL